MTDLTAWPAELPSGLRDLPAQVAALLVVSYGLSSELGTLEAGGPALAIITGSTLAEMRVLTELDRIISARTAPTVLVVGDGWIGTEGPNVAAAIAGAGAVALARSIAVRRRQTGRINVVCIPEALVGESGSQRGPLTLEITSADVAEVVAFALGEESAYVDGQVLYADGGRQLFSSLTA